jgi:membrane protease YdiL (CAAX protease family)
VSSRVARFADDHPASFSLLGIAIWLAVGAMAVAILATTTGLEPLSDTVQRVATLVATVVVLMMAGMAGWQQLVVGVTEEVVFRGLLMFGLARAWRDRRNGLAWAVIVQAECGRLRRCPT